jgi:hypothetical protein
MTEPREPTAEFESLLAAAIDGRLSESDRARLERMLEEDGEARESYIDQVVLHAMLRWEHALPLGIEANNSDARTTATDDPASGEVPVEIATPLFPVLLDTPASPHSVFSVPLGGFLFSYAVAAVIVAAGILLGWAYHVSIPQPNRPEIAQQPPRPETPPQRPEPEPVFVARITGSVDCRWVDPRTAPPGFDRIAAGRKFDLASGLLEITYDTGAKVILEGPSTYEVESNHGGRLSLGRLTALVEKKGERGQGRGERGQDIAANKQATIGNHRSASSLASPPIPLFSIRTPTAVITDLGTEFGVEVDKSGAGKTRVYQGKVELRIGGGAAKETRVVRLGENESARVEIGKDRVTRAVRETGRLPTFVRRMPTRVPIKLFNTGVNVKEGKPDPHWQVVARSDDPKFKPQPALMETPKDSAFLVNQFDRSQWISVVGAHAPLPNGVFFTFRTSFDLTGMRPATAILRGWFAVDNHIRSIRLNGREIQVPKHGHLQFGFRHPFSCSRGFVERINVLEIEVENGLPELNGSNKSVSPMCLLMELEGSAVPAWSGPSSHAIDVGQETSKN